VGRVLGRLWADRNVFDIGEIVLPTDGAAAAAARFVGAGRATADYTSLRPADHYLIGVQDRKIERCCRQLLQTGVLRPGDIVFHCSGSESSTVLQEATRSGARIASIHPLKSFADADLSIASFEGTYCGAEGDATALATLIPAFEAIGGRIIRIDSRYKTEYHAASVIVSNYVTALLEFGLRAYERSGIDRTQAWEVMAPLVGGTVENVAEKGTVQALTGPVSRGDVEVVARHLAAMDEWAPGYRQLYRDLGAIALELARLQGQADSASLQALESLLDD
jgi:predicted short-subunit dehydrogenase-like oxidoreductase (DUF2520 family)